MPLPVSPLASLQAHYRTGETTPQAELDAALASANSNAGHNVYLAREAAWLKKEVAALGPAHRSTQPLWGLPVSLKDCFDLAGFPTTCGSTFYRDRNGIASADSAVAARLRASGAVITGKTHLHQLAYGITGESRDFGDCLQPRNAAWLTGGSSSGAAASVQEGSALAAIGTDTGGSIRVPAALCGLTGYRSSITLNSTDIWRGGAHLAPTFDTLGWLYRDLRDGPLLAAALFNLPTPSPQTISSLRIGVPNAPFLHDCEPDVLDSLKHWEAAFAASGTEINAFDASAWESATGIFAPIQASEAANLHRGHFHHFEPSIANRLAWGASLSNDIIADLRTRLVEFRCDIKRLFDRFDYLLLPCAPMGHLAAGADHSQTRARILRYTAPISVAGLPVVTLPCAAGGMQLIAPLGSDAELLAVSAQLAGAAANANLHA